MKKNMWAILILIGLVAYGVYDYITASAKETKKEQASVASVTEPPNENIPIGVKKGQRAPDFTLNDLNGNPIQLSDYRGKMVLLNFWASWCPPCRAEMPHMQEFYEDYKKDTVVLGVNMTSIEHRAEDIKPFTEEFGLTFPNVLDIEGDVMEEYVVIAYPTTYVIDEQGVIREIYPGAINYDIMKKTREAF
ncbi:peroxiredoxin family protein [Paenibacillus dakarensis]|uniref:peroxiredoxin family protein n=1 Tax=Paenibacillus dakarensis TaxID=1527293 RepID=UPI0006D5599C|nr:TlpA disulfide reductase family protein [Paenibacillus dakarensis]